MPSIMKDWNNREIACARSKGGVCVAAHPYDNLISTGCSPWPTPEILQKLYQSRQVRAFEGDELTVCESGVGHYCDLQSLHSEDAITWSVFGTAAYAPQDRLELWVADLLSILRIPEASPDQSRIFLWRRIPHPDSLVPGGPEIDAGIISRNSVLFIEAKWQSQVGDKQGEKKDKDQIQLRGEFLNSKDADKIFPYTKVRAVVGISLSSDCFKNTVPQGMTFRCSNWDQVCSIPSHPLSTEIRRYYEWKRKHTKMPLEKAAMTRATG